MTATTAGIFIEILVGWALVWLADTLARVWVVCIRILARWWISALAFTFVIVKVLSITAFLDVIALTFARSSVEVLVIGTAEVFMTLAATGLFVKVLTWVAVI